MKHPENKAALIWISEELRRAENVKEHKRIVIDIVDGKAHHSEISTKTLFCLDNKK